MKSNLRSISNVDYPINRTTGQKEKRILLQERNCTLKKAVCYRIRQLFISYLLVQTNFELLFPILTELGHFAPYAKYYISSLFLNGGQNRTIFSIVGSTGFDSCFEF